LTSRTSGGWNCRSSPTADLQAASKFYVDTQIAAVSAAGVLVMEYTARTGTTAVNPGSGRIAWNSANQFDATQLYINSVSAINRDWTSFWAALQIGQKITIQLKANSAVYGNFVVASVPVNNGGWFTVGVTGADYKSIPFANNASLLVGVVGASATQFLPLSGGTMTGPVSFTSGSSSVTPTPGDNDTSIATTAFVTSALSAFTGGGGVVSEAPVDGTAYGRLSATWNKVPWFTAKGNVFLGTAEPANISPALPEYGGGILSAWHIMADGIANDAYYDGNAFRRTSATAMPIWLSVSGGALAFQTAPVGALDSVASLSTMFYVDGGGSTTATGSVWAINRTGAFGLTDFGSGYFGLRFTSDWWRLAFNSNTGDLIYIHPDGRWLHNFTAAGGINMGGLLQANGGVYATGGSYLFGSGSGRVDGDWYAGGLLYSIGSRIQARGAYTNPSMSVWNTPYGCAGWWYDTANFCWGNCDGGGVPVAGWGYTNPSMFYVNGSFDGGYIHSRGDINADGNTNAGRVRAWNSIMNSSGAFFVADNEAYYLARNPNDGAWRFVEGGTVNLTIDTGGGLNARWGYTGPNFHCTSFMYCDGNIQGAAVYGRNGIFAGWNGDNTLGMFRSGGQYIHQMAGTGIGAGRLRTAPCRGARVVLCSGSWFPEVRTMALLQQPQSNRRHWAICGLQRPAPEEGHRGRALRDSGHHEAAASDVFSVFTA
jgi:hypothetical protein